MSYTIDLTKAGLSELNEVGKISIWLQRIAKNAYHLHSKINSQDFEKSYINEFYPFYYRSNERTKKNIIKNMEGAIIVLMQNPSLVDMSISIMAYKALLDCENKDNSLPTIYRTEVSEYLKTLGTHKILNNTNYSDTVKTNIEARLCELY